MGKNLLLILLLLGVASAWYVPVAYPLFPAPVVNVTSSAFCELQSNVTQAINITAALQHANGTNISVATVSTSTNVKTTMLTYSNFTAGDNVTVYCLSSTYSANSEVQHVLSTNFGSNTSDAIVTATLLTLAVFVAVFSYLHVHSGSPIWSEAWYLVAGLLSSFIMLSIMVFAQDEGANGVENVGLALFIGTFWAFFLGLAIFGFNLLLSTIKLVRDTIKKYF